MEENVLVKAARRQNSSLNPGPPPNPNPTGTEAEKGPSTKAAEKLNQEQKPEEQLSKAKVQSEIAKLEADAAEARKREQTAKAALEATKRLTPEQHGELVSGLVTRLIEGGIEPQRAYTLALQALSPGAAPPASSIESRIVTDFLDTVLDEWKRSRVRGPRSETAESAPRTPFDPGRRA